MAKRATHTMPILGNDDDGSQMKMSIDDDVSVHAITGVISSYSDI